MSNGNPVNTALGIGLNVLTRRIQASVIKRLQNHYLRGLRNLGFVFQIQDVSRRKNSIQGLTAGSGLPSRRKKGPSQGVRTIHSVWLGPRLPAKDGAQEEFGKREQGKQKTIPVESRELERTGKERGGGGQDQRGRKKSGEKQTETDRRKEECLAQGAGPRRPSRLPAAPHPAQDQFPTDPLTHLACTKPAPQESWPDRWGLIHFLTNYLKLRGPFFQGSINAPRAVGRGCAEEAPPGAPL